MQSIYVKFLCYILLPPPPPHTQWRNRKMANVSRIKIPLHFFTLSDSHKRAMEKQNKKRMLHQSKNMNAIKGSKMPLGEKYRTNSSRNIGHYTTQKQILYRPTGSNDYVQDTLLKYPIIQHLMNTDILSRIRMLDTGDLLSKFQ